MLQQSDASPAGPARNVPVALERLWLCNDTTAQAPQGLDQWSQSATRNQETVMTSKRVESIDPPTYIAPRAATAPDEDAVIAHAIRILESRVRRGDILQSSADARNMARLQLSTLDHDVFAVFFLDAQHRVIQFEQMFRGTIGQTSVYPREVVKRSLELNASAVVLAHNHPSGSTEPSRADEFLTQTLKAALALVDVQILDHIVVSVEGCTSFAERGLL